MALLKPVPSDQFEPPERRLVPRYRIVGSGLAVFTTEHARLPCLVEDLSAGGARLRLGGRLGFGCDGRIEIAGGGSAPGSCVWSQSGMAGIAFRPGLETLRFFIAFALAPRATHQARMSQAPFL